ncbi:hypothetical protein PIB30_003203 [Stylosanthes scabra]|uniref:Uncharacterized protein n=1 Tax=Stylosanthes scabra TaxID=79078 RepID=A0ABU6Q345_9FABA|nr:hypothetical protein [Stylosanthes scabra]
MESRETLFCFLTEKHTPTRQDQVMAWFTWLNLTLTTPIPRHSVALSPLPTPTTPRPCLGVQPSTLRRALHPWPPSLGQIPSIPSPPHFHHAEGQARVIRSDGCFITRQLELKRFGIDDRKLILNSRPKTGELESGKSHPKERMCLMKEKSKKSKENPKAQFHARTAPPPRLGVGFHYSPRLGVAGKPKARQNQVAACSRRERQPMTAPSPCFSVDPSWQQNPSHAWTMLQRGSSVISPQLSPKPNCAR